MTIGANRGRGLRRAGPGRRPGASRSSGFALVVVVWGLGLITLLGTMAIVGARYRSRDVSGLSAVAHASAAAESAVMLGILRASDPAGPVRRWSPLRCTLPDGAAVTVEVTSETGKVDLNAAPVALLARLFAGLTRDPVRGSAVAKAVAAYRAKGEPAGEAVLAAAYRADGKPEGPKHAPFLTPLELDQVEGLTPELVAAALPYLTVVAGRPEPDPDAAPPRLRDLLALAPQPQQAASAAPAAPAPVTVRAEARTPDGARAVREALVTFGAGAAPFAITEWREGLAAPDAARFPDLPDARPCLR